jgi:arylsulfatase
MVFTLTLTQAQNIIFMMADQLRFDALSYARTDNSSAFYTPSLDRIKSEGLSISHSYSSTPTCTPARAALLTGQSPWNHGMIGYGKIAPRYKFSFPKVLSDSNLWLTASIGKDHFGWNDTSNQGISHGYQTTTLYDGLGSFDSTKPHDHVGEFDDYDQWFESVMPGKDPQATMDGFDGSGWNSWNGAPFVYDEYYHPTAWVGRRAVEFINKYVNATKNGIPTKPFLLKISFHRPHSPYDPPKRILDAITKESLPKLHECQAVTKSNPYPGANDSGHGNAWSLRFRGNSTLGDPVGCGPTKESGGGPDAWCGKMNPSNQTLARRAYAGSVRFVDEQIGHIYQTLKSTSLLDNTWIIFTADHGDGQGDHYHWRKGFPCKNDFHC